MSRLFGASSSDRVDCGSPAVLDLLDPYTLLLWWQPTAWAVGGLILCAKGTSTTNSRRLSLRTTATQGIVNLTIDRATTDLSYTSSSAVFATLNAWYWVGLSFNSANGAGTLAKLYKGDLATPTSQLTFGSTDGAGALQSDAAESLIIGNRSNADVALTGALAHVSLWSSELTPAQIERARSSTLHSSLSGEFAATCVGEWRLAESEAAPDLSGNGNNGTITGATAAIDPPLLVMRRKRRRA